MVDSKASNTYKIVVLGEGKPASYYKTNYCDLARVGKSSITLKYCKDKFSDKQESTVDATHLSKDVQIDAKTTVGLTIWDTAG